MNQKNKFMTEKQTINVILDLARQQGVEDKVKNLIVKFQDVVKGAKTPEEQQHIAALGIAEIYKTIGCVGGLVVNGMEIIPPNLSYKEDINLYKGLVKLD